jgi:hypothetical protein
VSRLAASLLACSLLVICPEARATGYVVTFCVKLATDFTDATAGDFWPIVDENRIARGAFLTVEEYDQGVSQGPLWNDYLTDDGCFVATFYTNREYEISTRSKAVVNGVTINVFDDDTSPVTYTHVFFGPSDRFVPTSSASYDLIMQPHDVTDTMVQAVATRAMYNNNVGLGASTPLDFANNDCCYVDGDYIFADTASRSKISHETGHMVYTRRDAGTLPNFSYGSDEDNCDGDDLSGGHSLTTKEWYSGAFVEGFADGYSTWLWNDTIQSDCEYDRHYPTDFDLDGDLDNVGDNVSSCEGIPVSLGLASYVTARDWLDDLVSANDPAGCAGTLNHRSTQYDSLRYVWDMLSDEGVPIEDWVDIVDGANPRNWNASFDAFNPNDDPEDRLEASADANGWGAAHDAQKTNGQDH